MRRIAIIDHVEHELLIEDIDEYVLEKQYGGDEQAYIDDNYDLENYSWDWITDTYYISDEGDPDPIEVDFKDLV